MSERSVVDAHAHVWDRERTPIEWIDESLPEIDRDFSVADLERAAAEAAAGLGVRMGGWVLVQALNDVGETRDLLETAHGPVVGWVDLAGADVAEQLTRLRELPGGERLVGARHLAHVDPDPEWLLRPDVATGFEALATAGLVFDLVVRPWQLRTAARAADAHPELQFVLDHLGQPPVAGIADADAFARWESDLRALAQRPNVVAKVSGVAVRGTVASAARLERVGGVALEAFGPDRSMFGSDWPLVRLADDLEPWLAQYLEWSAALSPHEREAIDSRTAHDTYGAPA